MTITLKNMRAWVATAKEERKGKRKKDWAAGSCGKESLNLFSKK